MGSNFKPLRSKQEAEKIEKAIKESRGPDSGLAFDKETGEPMGACALNDADESKANMAGKYDTHYRSPVQRAAIR